MAIIVNTNMSAINIQGNLSNASEAMQKAMLRMSTGSKINSAADDAAGMAVSTSLKSQISGSKVAQTNVQLGSNLLTTTEGTLNVVQTNVQRIRDLIAQASSGTYNQKAKTAIRTEIVSRMQEIDRQGAAANFNGTKLFDSTTAGAAGQNGIALQVGAGGPGQTATDQVITLGSSMFTNVNVSALGMGAAGTVMTQADGFDAILGNAAGTGAATGALLTAACSGVLSRLDTALQNVVDRKTSIGAAQNKLSSVGDSLKVQITNLSSANSTINDADIAEESASYVQNQILQNASASLLAQANQAPGIAINLV